MQRSPQGLAAQRQNTPGLARPPRRRRKGRTMQGHAVAKTVRSALLVGLSVLLLSGCGLLGRNVDTGPTPEAAKGVVRTAYAQMGKNYRSGGASPQKGFDCSGLIWWVYNKNGVKVPRITVDQARIGQSVPREQVRPGDIVVFRTSASPRGHRHLRRGQLLYPQPAQGRKSAYGEYGHPLLAQPACLSAARRALSLSATSFCRLASPQAGRDGQCPPVPAKSVEKSLASWASRRITSQSPAPIRKLSRQHNSTQRQALSFVFSASSKQPQDRQTTTRTAQGASPLAAPFCNPVLSGRVDASTPHQKSGKRSRTAPTVHQCSKPQGTYVGQAASPQKTLNAAQKKRAACQGRGFCLRFF